MVTRPVLCVILHSGEIVLVMLNATSTIVADVASMLRVAMSTIR
jgi:hypothetical protein